MKLVCTCVCTENILFRSILVIISKSTIPELLAHICDTFPILYYTFVSLLLCTWSKRGVLVVIIKFVSADSILPHSILIWIYTYTLDCLYMNNCFLFNKVDYGPCSDNLNIGSNNQHLYICDFTHIIYAWFLKHRMIHVGVSCWFEL